MIRAKALKADNDPEKLLENLQTFVSLTGRPPRVHDSDWHPEDQEMAEHLEMRLQSPKVYVKEFGGLSKALTLAASFNEQVDEVELIMKLVLVKLNLGRYPQAVLVGDQIEWDEETQELCRLTNLTLSSPFTYGDTFGSIKQALSLAEENKKNRESNQCGRHRTQR